MAVVGIAQGKETGTAGAPRRPVLWLIAVAGATAAAVASRSPLTSDHQAAPEIQGALMAWIILSYVFAGLVAWWRRPDNHFGPLMIAAGFGVFLSSLTAVEPALPFTIGVAFDLGAAVLFLHVCLAFPSGRLDGPWERALVGVGVLHRDRGPARRHGRSADSGPTTCWPSFDEPDTAYTLLRVQLLVLSAICSGRDRLPRRAAPALGRAAAAVAGAGSPTRSRSRC